MLNLLFMILFIFNQRNCININEDLPETFINDIEPYLSRTYQIKYLEKSIFPFNITEGNILRINIHGINCNFKIDLAGESVNKINLDTYSILITESKNIGITPLIDMIDGECKENYEMKTCYLSINSYLVNDKNSKLEINNKEENIIYLDNSTNNKSITLNYIINEVFNDSFISLYFQFNEKSNISINIKYLNDSEHNNSI